MPVDGDVILKAGLDTTNITKRIDGLQKTVSKGLKNAIRIGFGVRSVFALIRRLRSALFEGFGDLAQVYEPFNYAMSSITTSLKTLRNTFASAFAPIIETVAPILVNFINLISRAVAAIGQFIAALTGKEYVAAGEVWQDYASSVAKGSKSTDNATQSTKDQTKAQKQLNKELKKEITAIDDLIILHNDYDDAVDDTPDTSIGTTDVPETAFSPVGIGNAVSKFAKDFLAAWANADFTDIGRLVGEKLKTALENIPWAGINNVLQKIAKSIATFLNGFLETPGLFDIIGKTIAKGINTAFRTVDTFVTTFHWNSLGKAIKDLLLGTLNGIDWNLIYKTARDYGAGIGTALDNALNDSRVWSGIFITLHNIVNAFANYLNGLIAAVNWGNLGTNITLGLQSGMRAIQWRQIYALASNFGTNLARFLNGLFNENTFKMVGETAAKFLNSAFIFLDTFGNTFDFTNFGSSLAAGINGFLNKFNTARLTSGVNAFVLGLRDAIVAFISKVNWYDLGAAVRDVITGISWDLYLLGVGKVIWEALNGVILFFKGLFNTDNITSPFTDALDELQTTISTAAEKIDFTAIADGIKKIVDALQPAIEGFGIGIVTVFKGLAEIGIKFFQLLGPALQKIADALGSMDPELLKLIGEALGVIAGTFIAMTIAETVASGLGKLLAIFKLLLPAATGLVGAAGTATVAGTGLMGVLSVLGLISGAALGAAIGVAAFTTEIADEEEEIAYGKQIHQELIGILQSLQTEYGLTDEQVKKVASALDAGGADADELAEHYSDLNTELEKSGVNIADFKTSLINAAEAAGADVSNMAVIQKYIQDVGTSASDADTDTSGLAMAFDAFEGLGYTTPLKMALLSGAIKLIGDKGLTTKDNVNNLYSALDKYKADPTEKNLAKVQKAFEDTGISADTFSAVLGESFEQLDPKMRQELTKSINAIDTYKSKAKEKYKGVTKSGNEGAIEGHKETKDKVVDAGKDVVKSDIEGMYQEADSHSPSKKTQELGRNIDEGLKSGMTDNKESVVQAGKDLIQEIFDAMNDVVSDFSTLGSDIINAIDYGISNNAYTVVSNATGVVQGIYDQMIQVDFEGVGTNIADGIYNGLISNSARLEVLAWNTAVAMFNSACEALDIASPSKKFAWIGKMTMQGLTNGIIDTGEDAVDAVTDLSQSMTDEAEKINPSIALDTSVTGWINSLDTVLTKFSTMITDRFDNLATSLSQLGTLPAVPAVAQGMVIPSSVKTISTDDNDTSYIKDMMQSLANNQMTYDELRSLLVEMFTTYMNLSWSINDEQLARHVNNGNSSLNRRYNINL